MYRAVLNGKRSVNDAENIHALITSATEYGRRLAASGIENEDQVQAVIKEWRIELIDIISSVEMGLDFEDTFVVLVYSVI